MLVCVSSLTRVLTFALLDVAPARTINDLRASPWSLSHHLVKVNCRVGVVQIVVREELRLVFVSQSLCTSLQVRITVTNLKDNSIREQEKVQFRLTRVSAQETRLSTQESANVTSAE